ncbi:glycosyltransferase family 4 protein [Actinoallomurus purpureus]|uniref:glycosyltransferase family 4 protein n=1 Tax=Actinoallomurus purpureus TaxID=478114 RepID=UPI002092AE5A|nr:glycosyltransferase family 4 protein [Actinoallomurus purpureus]MCO6004836.1 glycosyltransferase family 4 protein [Actinoallomurus purpureus]
MKIAIVGPAFPYKGGGAHHTTELAHRLAAAGHDVTLESWKAQYPSFLYPGEQTIATPEGEPYPGTRHTLAWYRPDGWLRIGRRLRSQDLVILVVLSPVQVPAYLGMLVGLGAREEASGPRVIALCHNVLPHERKPYDVPLMRRLLKRVDGALVHSAQQAQLARDLAPGTPVRTAVLPAHLPTPPHGTPVFTGAPEGPWQRLLFFGMVRPYKGLDVLLRALARMDDVALTVAGEFWGGAEEVRGLISSLGLEDRVELRPGYVPAAEVPELFARADALVLPYRTATASQNVFMAYEHGIPVIATRAGTLADHVREGVDGVLCEADDVDSLADALRRFYAPGEPARLRAGVRPVDSEPHWASYLEQLLTAGPLVGSGAGGEERSA